MNLLAPLTDRQNALECLRACQAVYYDCTLETDDAHVSIADCASHIKVVMRGSKSPEDWINDADFELIDTIYGRVHRGFFKSWSSIASRIHGQLRNMRRVPIVVSGHSLGGDQARIGALDLHTAGFAIDRVITFGAARTGGSDFRDYYDARLLHCTIGFVNARDIVPRVPFSAMGYCHVGNYGLLTSTGGLVLNPNILELTHDDVVGAVNDLRDGKITVLSDHHLENYAARIQALV
jgi:predicted lipase